MLSHGSWTLWNRNSVYAPRTLVKHLPLATIKIRHPGYSMGECPERWEITDVAISLKSHNKPKTIRASLPSSTTIILFIHSFIYLLNKYFFKHCSRCWWCLPTSFGPYHFDEFQTTSSASTCVSLYLKDFSKATGPALTDRWSDSWCPLGGSLHQWLMRVYL